MKVIDLTPVDDRAIEQVAALLVDGFRDSGSMAWRTLEDALTEVRESFQAGRISRIAVEEPAEVIGWIGGIETYEGNVWELHPLVVRRDRQGEGIGRALVLDLERQVAQRGAHTIFLGTDDENGRTTLGGIDLYPGVLDRLREIRNVRRHPFEFYLRMGFEIVGVIPDANGFGKPDILMARRVADARG
jgi:aminoglycoside 6'-N-acetyltransferase I